MNFYYDVFAFTEKWGWKWTFKLSLSDDEKEKIKKKGENERNRYPLTFEDIPDCRGVNTVLRIMISSDKKGNYEIAL